MKKLFLIPLVLFFVLVVFLAVGLQRDPKEIPSPLVGKAAPAFKLFTLAANDETFEPKDMQGQVWMLNVWATWCVLPAKWSIPFWLSFPKCKTCPLWA
jgi:cytochrome c biogenesis protein CcmG/thiol:disulfide interchange protein DsbE